jgi:hypothetical protein
MSYEKKTNNQKKIHSETATKLKKIYSAFIKFGINSIKL